MRDREEMGRETVSSINRLRRVVRMTVRKTGAHARTTDTHIHTHATER